MRDVAQCFPIRYQSPRRSNPLKAKIVGRQHQQTFIEITQGPNDRLGYFQRDAVIAALGLELREIEASVKITRIDFQDAFEQVASLVRLPSKYTDIPKVDAGPYETRIEP